MNLKEIQKKIGYTFQDESILVEALTHPSYANERGTTSNQRLEFLGDSILELIITDYLFSKYPLKDEGQLTRLRSDMVCSNTQYQIAKKLDIRKNMLLGIGESNNKLGERKQLSDLFEALIGAIYQDGKLEAARQFVYRFVLSCFDKDIAHSQYVMQQNAIMNEYVIQNSSNINNSRSDSRKMYDDIIRIDAIVQSKKPRSAK